MRLVPAAFASMLALFWLAFFCVLPSTSAQQLASMDANDALAREHATPEWANIALHLPDPATSSPTTLEMAADTLRARRYPQDALHFYSAAMARGGHPNTLLKKTGITCLEMQQIQMARAYFQQATRLDKHDAGAWNNLAAAEFLSHDMHGAIRDYKRAVKLENTSALFHGNLALAYFEVRKSEAARRELAAGLALDPDLLHRSSRNGYVAQVLASERYSEICFEMARIYAGAGNMDAVLEWLTKASDRGYNVRAALDRDATLRPLLGDARVQVLLKNTQQLEAKEKAPANIPSLGPANH